MVPRGRRQGVISCQTTTPIAHREPCTVSHFFALTYPKAHYTHSRDDIHAGLRLAARAAGIVHQEIHDIGSTWYASSLAILGLFGEAVVH